jgi:hypothetical protein
MVRLSVFCSPDHVRSPGSLKLRGAKRGPRQARRWLDGVEIRRASTCHPERAAVSAANEGSKSATPSAPPPPSRVIPDWRVLAGGAFQIIPDWRRVQRFASIWRRIRTKPRGAKTAALPTVIVSERRSRESNDLNWRSPPCLANC